MLLGELAEQLPALGVEVEVDAGQAILGIGADAGAGQVVAGDVVGVFDDENFRDLSRADRSGALNDVGEATSLSCPSFTGTHQANRFL